MDEAYFEYVDSPDYPNSLDYRVRKIDPDVADLFEGLRVGGNSAWIWVANPEVIETLYKVRMTYSVSGPAIAAGLAALDDNEHVEKSVRLNRSERDFVSNELSRRGVKCISSFTNFILMDLGIPAEPVVAALLEKASLCVRRGEYHGIASVARHPRAQRKISVGVGESSVTIKEILETYHTIAVVGLSSRPYRASYGVSRYMQRAGYRIIPVNPTETEVLGEKAYPSLDDVPESFEIVDIFRRPEFVPEIVEAAIRRKAQVVWMQQGVIHEAAAQHARAAGLEVVMDLCILQEHMALF